jgi:lipoate-protein ligase A
MGWLLLVSGVGEAAFNMAMDEALLLEMPRLQTPVLRFYGWTEKAASFGYFQKYAEVEAMTGLRPLVRRPTGGGLVPHDADWTYSLTFPTGHPWYAFAARESYRRVHEWIKSALGQIGVTTELAPESRRAGPGQCFVGYEQSDVLWNGLKIAGAAQRRTRDGLLIQGSVQAEHLQVTRSDWENAMASVSPLFIPGPGKPFTPDPLLLEQTDLLVRKKYFQPSYNRRR